VVNLACSYLAVDPFSLTCPLLVPAGVACGRARAVHRDAAAGPASSPPGGTVHSRRGELGATASAAARMFVVLTGPEGVFSVSACLMMVMLFKYRSDCPHPSDGSLAECVVSLPLVQVSPGYGRGSKKLGVPTANLPESQFQESLRGVAAGVYLGWARVDGGGIKKAVVNVGYSPTFVGQVRVWWGEYPGAMWGVRRRRPSG
jgi:hypothetical protein